MDVSPLTPTPLLDRGLSIASTGTSRAVDPKSPAGIARGFESMFLSHLLKEMRQTLEPGTLFGEDKSDILGGLFDQFLAEHLSGKNALGIAAMVRQQLERTTPTHDSYRHGASPAPSQRLARPSLS